VNVTGPDEIHEMIFLFFSAVFCSSKTARAIKLGRIASECLTVTAAVAADNNNNDDSMITIIRCTGHNYTTHDQRFLTIR